jgi:hypothetical protein
VIRINIHPTGENPTNTTRTLLTPVHVCLMYASCRRSPYVVTFHESSTGLDVCTTPEKKCFRLSFSLNTAIEAMHLSQAPIDDRLLGLPGTYHWHTINAFNIFSLVPTPWSLTDTGGAYHIEILKLPQHTSRPSLSSVPLTPPKWLHSISILSNINIQ